MHHIEPIYDEYWDEGREEFVSSDILIGYRVVSQNGKIIGDGETREEALAAAFEAIMPLTHI